MRHFLHLPIPNKTATPVAFLFTALFIMFCVYILYPSFNPLNSSMFDFHDTTQLARVKEYSYALSQGKIPPRIAPHSYFGMGWPLFNYYAPFSHVLTSALHLSGIGLVSSLKLSFLLALACGTAGMILFLRNHFDYYSSLLGATVYITSTYMATETVIRGNLAEIWFAGIFPLSLWAIHKNARTPSRTMFIATTCIIALTLLTHNIFSLIGALILCAYILFLPQRGRNIASLIYAVLIGSFFILPALLERSLVHLRPIITQYSYNDHFLCVHQWWSSSSGWQFGPSLPGCDDAMSFKLGKSQLLLGCAGLCALIAVTIRKGRGHLMENAIPLFVGGITATSLFLTISPSKPLWDIFSPLMGYFQFPWRFMLLALWGVSFFSGYLINGIPSKKMRILLCAILLPLLFLPARKYLIKPLYSEVEYMQKYASNTYIQENFSYMTPEYLTSKANPTQVALFNPGLIIPRRMDFNYQVPATASGTITTLLNSPYKKIITAEEPQEITLNVHYLPHWGIYINEIEHEPLNFDPWGRPIIKIGSPSTVVAEYRQTPVQMGANLLSLSAVALLLIHRRFFLK